MSQIKLYKVQLQFLADLFPLKLPIIFFFLSIFLLFSCYFVFWSHLQLGGLLSCSVVRYYFFFIMTDIVYRTLNWGDVEDRLYRLHTISVSIRFEEMSSAVTDDSDSVFHRKNMAVGSPSHMLLFVVVTQQKDAWDEIRTHYGSRSRTY